jgi:hypothetical protein
MEKPPAVEELEAAPAMARMWEEEGRSTRVLERRGRSAEGGREGEEERGAPLGSRRGREREDVPLG